MLEGTLEYIDHQRESMQPDEWLTYLVQLRDAIRERIFEASEITGPGDFK
jgi:hypothetical protein